MQAVVVKVAHGDVARTKIDADGHCRAKTTCSVAKTERCRRRIRRDRYKIKIAVVIEIPRCESLRARPDINVGRSAETAKPVADPNGYGTGTLIHDGKVLLSVIGKIADCNFIRANTYAHICCRAETTLAVA